MIAVLFDLDGTLVDSSEGVLDSLRHMLSACGRGDLPDDTLRSWIGPPLQICATELAGAATTAELERAVGAYRSRYRQRGVHLTAPFDGIPKLLKSLAARDDVRLGVATSKPTEFAQQILTQHGLDALLPVVRGADWEGRLSKADLVLEALERVGGHAERSVMIGDRRYDIEGAHEHGLSAVGVSYGFGTSEELEAAGADVICDSVAALETALNHFLR